MTNKEFNKLIFVELYGELLYWEVMLELIEEDLEEIYTKYNDRDFEDALNLMLLEKEAELNVLDPSVYDITFYNRETGKAVCL